MKKGNYKKTKEENKRKFTNKHSANEDESYKKYNEAKNAFNLASLDKIREEYNDPKKAFVKKNEKDISENSNQESNSDNDSENNLQESLDNNDECHSSSEDSEIIQAKKFDIKLFMMVFFKSSFLFTFIYNFYKLLKHFFTKVFT